MNNRYTLIGLILFLLVGKLYSQTPIILTNQTTKVGALAEENLYFGFNEGDIIELDYKEERNKGLKEVEVIAYPNQVIYSEYEPVKIEAKQIVVPKTGIYKFRFYNSSLGKRIARINIKRIPKVGTVNFNSTVYWKTLYDTTYSLKDEKYLERIDTSITNNVNSNLKVNSISNRNGNRLTYFFQLPSNTISWSYYIGVGQEGQKALEEATTQMSKAASSVSSIPSIGPLAALALGGAPIIAKLQNGEDVKFYITDVNGRNSFISGLSPSSYKSGKVVNDYGVLGIPEDRKLFFCFENDNAVMGIAVNLNITTIVIDKIWKIRTLQVPKITSYKVPYLKN